MKLVIHRGAHEVGGSCVELTYKDSTILLDIGFTVRFLKNRGLKAKNEKPADPYQSKKRE